MHSPSPPSTRAPHTGLLFGPLGRPVADGIVHWDGADWTREPIEVPVGSEGHLRILAVDATGIGNAWAIAEGDEALGQSLVLLQRTSTPKGPLWVERPLERHPVRGRGRPGRKNCRSGSDRRRRPAAYGHRRRPLDRPDGDEQRGGGGRLSPLLDRVRGGQRVVVRHRALRRRARRQALPADRLPELRLAGQRIRHPDRHQPARSRRWRRNQSRHLPAVRRRLLQAAARQRQQLPRQRGLLERRTAAGSRAWSRSPRKPRPPAPVRGRSRFAPRWST